MKKCPYCAEDIQDAAIKCRYCGSDLTVPVGAPASSPQPSTPVSPPTAGPPVTPPPSPAARQVGEGAERFSHSGYRYLLGYGRDYFGIWDRQMPGGPVQTFPRSDEGWREAWVAYSAREPHAVAVSASGGTTGGPIGGGARWGTYQRATAVTTAGGGTGAVSAGWWLLPVLFGTLGGIVAWAVNHNRDPRTARNMLLTGIALSVVLLLVYMASGPR